MINEIIAQAEAECGKELLNIFADLETKIDRLRHRAVEKYPNIPRENDGLVANSISLEDARLLYLLVRVLKPKVIFEVGTWVGTSAMVMAEAMRANANGGQIYTCDADNYYSVDDTYCDIITPLFKWSDIAITDLPRNTKIDFVFADGELTFKTIKVLKPKLAKNAVITTHDFELPAEKGVLNLVRMQLMTFCKYTYVLPEQNNYEKYNSGALGLLIYNPKTFAISKWYKTFKLGFNALIIKGYRKFIDRSYYPNR